VPSARELAQTKPFDSLVYPGQLWQTPLRFSHRLVLPLKTLVGSLYGRSVHFDCGSGEMLKLEQHRSWQIAQQRRVRQQNWLRERVKPNTSACELFFTQQATHNRSGTIGSFSEFEILN
jgi:hypothetical protein